MRRPMVTQRGRRQPLPHRHPKLSPAEARDEADRQTASLAAIVVILGLLTAGLFLVHTLRHAANVEDCLMAGRRDCDTTARLAR